MLISFSGTLVPYTYNCPHAHRLRNIQQIRIERPEPEESEEGISRRQRGIELHDQLGEYLKANTDTFEFVTDTIEFFRGKPNLVVEQPYYFDETLSPVDSKQLEGHTVYIRPDAAVYELGVLYLSDWKFANPEYGAARYYDETEFFASCLASLCKDLDRVEIDVHFPEHNYTLPKRVHSFQSIMQLQQKYIARIERIINDKICKPIPSKARCRFCDYREEVCEYSV